MARDRAGNLDGDGGGLPATALAVSGEPAAEEVEARGRGGSWWRGGGRDLGEGRGGRAVSPGRLLAGGMTSGRG